MRAFTCFRLRFQFEVVLVVVVGGGTVLVVDFDADRHFMRPGRMVLKVAHAGLLPLATRVTKALFYDVSAKRVTTKKNVDTEIFQKCLRW